MRFVNCACHEGHQNLIAFQYDGQVYYKTYRDIPPNTELLVWYGQQYGAELGITSEEKAISPDTGTTDNVDENMDVTCSDIVNTGYIDENEIDVCCHIDQTESLQLRISHVEEPSQTHCAKCSIFKTAKLTYEAVEIAQKRAKITYEKAKLMYDRHLSFAHVETKMALPLKVHETELKRISEHLENVKLKVSNNNGAKDVYECHHCGQKATSMIEHKKHILTHSDVKVPDILSSSPPGIISPSDVKSEVKPITRTAARRHQCKTCAKGFRSPSQLLRHIRTHTGEKPYICTTCGMGFSQSGHLKIHIRTHTGEKPYICTTCGKGFNDGGNLKNHIRIHTGEKPYICTTCGKGFNDGGNLKNHIRTHTGEKPYICTTCGKGFSQSSSLKGHIRTHTHTQELPLICPTCGKSYSHRRFFQQHINKHHK